MCEVKYTLFPANEASRGERKYHVPNATRVRLSHGAFASGNVTWKFGAGCMCIDSIEYNNTGHLFIFSYLAHWPPEEHSLPLIKQSSLPCIAQLDTIYIYIYIYIYTYGGPEREEKVHTTPTYLRSKVTGRTPRWTYLGNLPDTACYTGNSKLVLSPTSCCIIAHSVVCIDGMGWDVVIIRSYTQSQTCAVALHA